MKFLKLYYYTLLGIALPLIPIVYRFITNQDSTLTKDRFIICLLSGLIVTLFGILVERGKSKTGLNRLTVIGIIIGNAIFWLTLVVIAYSATWENIPFSTEDNSYYPSMWIGHFFNAVVFYVNSLFLFPYYFQKKKEKYSYWGLSIFLILGTAAFEALADLQLANHLELIPKLEEYYVGLPVELVLFDWTIQYSFIHTFYFLLSFVLIFVLQFSKYQKEKASLEKEKLNAELKYLKAQINPHFLFNGINSVYHLIDRKPAIAKDTLLKFSNLLRYQLYECNDELIPLEKELEHIQDYVEMEKIRKGDDVVLELSLPEETHEIKIPPLLFTPFIENAFKYVSNHDEGAKNQIHIQFRLFAAEGKLDFEATNTVDINKPISKGGIGIINVKQRLALLFPDSYDLDITEGTNKFTVRMTLQLKRK